jgi:hypothetical protein
MMSRVASAAPCPSPGLVSNVPVVALIVIPGGPLL